AVLLRSFRDDGRAINPNVKFWQLEHRTLDEVIAELLDGRVPLRTVQDPRHLAQLGSTPVAISTQNWLLDVGEIVERAPLVIFLFGETEGVLMELDLLFERGALDKTLLLFPPFGGWLEDREEEVKKRRKAFRRFVRERADALVEAKPGGTS